MCGMYQGAGRQLDHRVVIKEILSSCAQTSYHHLATSCQPTAHDLQIGIIFSFEAPSIDTIIF